MIRFNGFIESQQTENGAAVIKNSAITFHKKYIAWRQTVDTMGTGISVNMEKAPIACVGKECECRCRVCSDGKHCRRLDCYVEEFHPYQADCIAA